MMFNLKKGFITVVFFVSVASAFAGALGLSAGGGVYQPTHSETQELYGKSWYSYGIYPSVFGACPVSKPSLGPGISFLSKSKNGNKLFLLAPSYGITQNLPSLGGIVPYVGASAGPILLRYKFQRNDEQIKKTRIGGHISAQAGFKIMSRVQLGAEYNFFTKHNGLDVNGLSLSASVRIL